MCGLPRTLWQTDRLSIGVCLLGYRDLDACVGGQCGRAIRVARPPSSTGSSRRPAPSPRRWTGRRAPVDRHVPCADGVGPRGHRALLAVRGGRSSRVDPGLWFPADPPGDGATLRVLLSGRHLVDRRGVAPERTRGRHTRVTGVGPRVRTEAESLVPRALPASFRRTSGDVTGAAQARHHRSVTPLARRPGRAARGGPRGGLVPSHRRLLGVARDLCAGVRRRCPHPDRSRDPGRSAGSGMTGRRPDGPRSGGEVRRRRAARPCAAVQSGRGPPCAGGQSSPAR